LLCACGYRQEPVLAKVGKSSITAAEFKRKLAELAPEFQNYVATPGAGVNFWIS